MAGKARRHHGGTVRRLSSGRWQVRVHDRATGRHLSLGTYPTKADGEAALARAVADQQRGQWVAPEHGKERLASYLAEWIDQHHALAVSTRDRYRSLARLHIGPHLGEARLADLTTASIRRWHADLSRSTSPSTAAKAYRLLRAALNTAVSDGMIPINPCQVAGAGVERSDERPVATVPEVVALADAMPPRWRALVLLAAWCGLRLGELSALTREDVDLEAGTVRVNKSRRRADGGVVALGPPKSDAGRRTVTVPPPLLGDVADHLATYTGPEADALVFTGERGAPLDRTRVNRAWQTARCTVGREDLRFHDLRHTGNTLAAATGASVAELMRRMGHASPAAALRYQHATQDRDRAIADALGGLMSTDSGDE